MSEHTKRSGDLRNIAWIVAVLLILFIVVFLLPFDIRPRSRVMQGRRTLDTLAMALEDYHHDFNAYPPDVGTSGSRMIALYLQRTHAVGSNHFGPYIKSLQDDPSGDFHSPLGGEYAYVILKEMIDGVEKEVGYVLVDPGRDKKLGGTINNRTGFEITDPEAAADNIYVPASVGSRKTPLIQSHL